MADAYTVAANALETIINTEFAAQGVTALHDRIHESMGLESVVVGISRID